MLSYAQEKKQRRLENAAPELLAALERVTAILVSYRYGHNDWEPAIEQARAAIAKAEGAAE
jgi:hypothetical protein